MRIYFAHLRAIRGFAFGHVTRVDHDRNVAFAEFGERALHLVLLQRLAVPAVLAFEERDALALDSARNDRCRTLRSGRP